MRLSVERVLTNCLNGSASLKKMAAMPILYGKKTKKLSSPEPRKL